MNIELSLNQDTLESNRMAILRYTKNWLHKDRESEKTQVNVMLKKKGLFIDKVKNVEN